VQYGIGGAFAGSPLPLGAAAAAACEVHTDTGAGEGDAWQGMEALGFALLPGPPPRYNELPIDLDLTQRLAAAAGIPTARFATSERVTGTLVEADRLRRRFHVDVESMEGAAAAQVCLALGVPFAEIRGISNVVGERDPRAWNVRAAARAAADAVVVGLRALEVAA
jgi:futalosine hydrolase